MLSSTLIVTGSLLLATLLQIPPPMADSAQSAELRGRRDEILSRERSKLSALADRLRVGGQVAEAGQVAPGPTEAPAADGSSRFVPLPEVVPAGPKGLANVEVGRAGGNGGWRADREAIRTEAARSLFDLAGKAAKAPSPSLAFADECLRAVIERQPDHAEARRLLGFLPRDRGWATPYAADMLDRGKVSDPKYGWVPGDWLPHLRRGELPGPRGSNRWMPAADADAIRRDWARKWEIETEHFRIYTNVPLDEAISFGRKLELLHELFFGLMADVIDSNRLPLAERFKKPGLKPALPSPGARKYYQVYYFATREEYAQYLAPVQGAGAKLSLGTYVPRKESKEFGGVSYFFNDVGGQLDVTSTLYHEASHQLLFESAGPDNYIQNAGNFWVFEGLGTYFETLQVEPDGSLRIGGMVGPRIAQARKRLLVGREFIPIEHLVALNGSRFRGDQGAGDIFLHYAESMALAVFLMQADGGRHREGFLDYVRDAYKGRFRGNSGRTLEDRVGIGYPEMNRAFLRYLEARSKP
jgi:Protein of unknown function (DUF1570)